MRRLSGSRACGIGDLAPLRRLHRPCPAEQTPRVQCAGDGPGLGGSAARTVRRIALENLADGAQSLVLQRIAYPLQQGLRRNGVAADAVRGEAEGSKEPGPNGPLVIAAVALRHA